MIKFLKSYENFFKEFKACKNIFIVDEKFWAVYKAFKYYE